MSPSEALPRLDRSAKAWLLALTGVCLALRAPALLYGVISDDEGIYAAMAREVVAGGVLYRDTVDHKPPGIVATYATAFWAAGGDYVRGMAFVHVLGMLVVLGTSLAIWAIGRRLLGHAAAPWAALLYAVFSATKVPCDGLAVNGELLMNLPTALAVLAAVEGTSRVGWRRAALDVVAGALGGCAVAYKYQAGLVLASIAVLVFEQGEGLPAGRWQEGVWARARVAVVRGVPWTLGALAPWAVCAGYFSAKGALSDAIFWGIEFNRHYLAEGPPPAWAARRFGAQLAGVVLPAVLLYVPGVTTTVRIGLADAKAALDVPRCRRMLATWALLSLAAIGLGGRVFGHYFLQAELPLSLAAAPMVRRAWLRSPRFVSAAAALPALFFLCAACVPIGHPGAWLDSPQPDYDRIGQSVARLAGPTGRIWVWGNVPQIYFASRRRPGVRFTFCNYLTGLSPGTPSEYDSSVDPGRNAVPGAMALAVEDLDRNRPAVVVDTAAAGLKSYGRFPVTRYRRLAAYLVAHYRRAGQAEGVVLYQRAD